jgi:Ni,Fe-hydrogenase III component G
VNVQPDLNLENLPGVTSWEQHYQEWWMKAPKLDVVRMAEMMLEKKARLMTMTGKAREDGETDIYYHYFLNNQIYNFVVQTHGQTLDSISVITPAAEWIEREIQDLFATTFSGHPNPGRLVRPSQLEAGFFRQPGGAASKTAE